MADSPKRPRGALALDIVARWREAGPGGLVFLSAAKQQAEYLGANIHSLFPDCPVLVLPRWDSLPYDPAGPSREIMGRRMSVLRRLAGGLERPLLIATPEAALQRVPPRELCQEAALRVAPGTRAGRDRGVSAAHRLRARHAGGRAGRGGGAWPCRRYLPGRRARPGAHRARGRTGHPHRQLRPGDAAHVRRIAGNRARRGVRIHSGGRGGAGRRRRQRRAAVSLAVGALSEARHAVRLPARARRC